MATCAPSRCPTPFLGLEHATHLRLATYFMSLSSPVPPPLRKLDDTSDPMWPSWWWWTFSRRASRRREDNHSATVLRLRVQRRGEGELVLV